MECEGDEGRGNLMRRRDGLGITGDYTKMETRRGEDMRG